MDPKLEEVFKKWEAHSSGPSRAANDEESQRQREERQREFRDNLEAPFRKPSRHRPRKRKSKREDFSFKPLTEVKFSVPHAVIPSMYKRKRPLMGEACDRCCRESKILYEEGKVSWGIRNVLSMDLFRKQNFLKRSFCHIAFVWNCDISHQYPDVKKDVLHSARVKTSILSPAMQEPPSSGQDIKL